MIQNQNGRACLPDQQEVRVRNGRPLYQTLYSAASGEQQMRAESEQATLN